MGEQISPREEFEALFVVPEYQNLEIILKRLLSISRSIKSKRRPKIDESLIGILWNSVERYADLNKNHKFLKLYDHNMIADAWGVVSKYYYGPKQGLS